jgi:hypothetical protein
MFSGPKLAQAAFLAVFVAWIAFGSWHSWQSALNEHYAAADEKQNYPDGERHPVGPPQFGTSRQEAGEDHKLTDSQQREAAQKKQELAIQRDIARFNRQLVIATWILGVVGLGTGIVLYFTLRATREAADHIPRVERAYLFIRPRLNWRRGAKWYGETQGATNPVQVTWAIINHGKTPAIINGLEIDFEMLTLEPDNTRFIPNILLESETVIEPGEQWPLRDHATRQDAIIGLGRELSAEDFDALSEGHAYLWFYGTVSYQDIFGTDHLTRFRWRGGGIIDVFTAWGSPPYNDRT